MPFPALRDLQKKLLLSCYRDDQPKLPLNQSNKTCSIHRAMLTACCRWFCHVDDDNYVILPSLLQLLSTYHHSQDVYLGRPSLDHPIEAAERVKSDGSVSLLTLHQESHKRRIKSSTCGANCVMLPSTCSTSNSWLSPSHCRCRLSSGLQQVEQGSVSAGAWHWKWAHGPGRSRSHRVFRDSPVC